MNEKCTGGAEPALPCSRCKKSRPKLNRSRLADSKNRYAFLLEWVNCHRGIGGGSLDHINDLVYGSSGILNAPEENAHHIVVHKLGVLLGELSCLIMIGEVQLSVGKM